MSKKSLAMTALLVAFSLLFAAPLFAAGSGESGGGAEPESVELSLSHWFAAGAPVEAIADGVSQFEADNPNVTVTIEQVPNAQYWQKIPAQAAAGDLPDAFQISSIEKYTLTRGNAVADLSQFLENDSEVDWDAFISAARQAMTVDGVVIGLPYALSSAAFVYRLDLFEEAGLATPGEDFNWDELVSNGQALTQRDADGNVTMWGFDSPGFGCTICGGLPVFILQNGGQVLTDDLSRAAFDSEEAIEAFQFFYDLVHEYEIMPSPTEAEGLGDLFQAGRTAQFQYGTWRFANYREATDFDWDVHALPQNTSHGGYSDVGGAAFGIANNAAYPDLAWELIKDVTQSLGAMAVAGGGDLPADSQYFDEWLAAPGPPYSRQEFLDWTMEYSRARPITPGFNQLRRDWQDEIILALNGQKTVEEATADAVRKVNAFLRQQQ